MIQRKNPNAPEKKVVCHGEIPGIFGISPGLIFFSCSFFCHEHYFDFFKPGAHLLNFPFLERQV